jgi:hypothetical protein
MRKVKDPIMTNLFILLPPLFSEQKFRNPLLGFHLNFKDGLALSSGPILAGWEHMSKQKPDRAISNYIFE